MQEFSEASGGAKVKRGTPNHPKTLELAGLLKRSRRDTIGLLELLFHFTAQYAPQGDIGRYSDKRIAAALDWQASPRTLIDALLEVGWIDADDRHRLVTHDWDTHLDDATRKYLQRNHLIPVKLTKKMTGHNPKMSDSEVAPAHPLPLPLPLPLPVPIEKGEPIHPSIPTSKAVMDGLTDGIPLLQKFQRAADEVRSFDPGATNEFLLDLLTRCGVTGNGHDPSDELVTEGIRHCRESNPKQFSAGLFRTKVPPYVKYRMEHPNKPPPKATSGKRSLADRTMDIVKQRLAKGERPV